MSAVKLIREQYKLSLSQMAAYLGISKSMLAMVELDRRSLSLDALRKLDTLGMSYEKNSREAGTAAVAIPVIELAAMRKQLKRILIKTNRKADLLQQKLDKHCNTFISGNTRAAAIRKLLNVAKKEKTTGHEKLLGIRLNETNKSILSCSPLERSLLLIKIEALKMEAALLQHLLRMPVSKGFRLTETDIAVCIKALQ